MTTKVRLVKAFTIDKDQGNPAGVVVDGNDLSDTKMQEIASELGFSVTTFVLKSEKADFRVRFFGPVREDSLCGHGTIATFHALIDEGVIHFRDSDKVMVTQETKTGVLSVICHKSGFIEMVQNDAEFFHYKVIRNEIPGLLGISKNDILDCPMQIVSAGKPKLLIAVKSMKILYSLKPDINGIKDYCKKSGARGFYPFTFDTKDDNSDVHARQFNPLAGIDEDPVTGTAAGPLVAYLKKHRLITKDKIVVEQGYIMNKAGKIYVDVAEKISVGGYAVTYGERLFD
jgi:PhzF family phenazine biosynthesis protein